MVTGTGRDPATFPADEKAVNWHDVHSTVEQIEAQGRRGLAFIGDISQQADVTRMVQQTLATLAASTFWSIMPRSPAALTGYQSSNSVRSCFAVCWTSRWWDRFCSVKPLSPRCCSKTRAAELSTSLP